MTAASIVPLDQLIASGTSYFGRPATPYVPGTQGVGVVEQSATWPQGARAFVVTTAGMVPGNGSLAELCAVPDEAVVPLPDGAADVDAAALGMSAVAAWMALTDRAHLAPGERVVVLGAGGTVGQVAVAAATLLGAARVVAVCRSAAAAERARRAGADEVVELDPDVDRLTDRLRDAVGAADVVVDPVFGVAATAASPGARAVRPPGEPRRDGRRHGRVLLRRPPQPHRCRPRLHERAAHRRPAAGRTRRRIRARGGRPADRRPRGRAARRGGGRLGAPGRRSRPARGWCSPPDPSSPAGMPRPRS